MIVEGSLTRDFADISAVDAWNSRGSLTLTSEEALEVVEEAALRL